MNFIKRMAFVVFFHYVCTKIARTFIYKGMKKIENIKTKQIKEEL